MTKNRVKKSLDGKCRFYEGTHTYYVGREKYPSATTVLKDFFSPFDVNKVAKLKAFISRRQGIKGQGIRYWKNKWKQTALDGTKVHAEIEDYLLSSNKFEQFEELKQCHPKSFSACFWLDENLKGYTKIIPEMLIYDTELKIAGQVDLVAEKDGIIDIVDYKTNEKITTEGYKGAKAKDPIGDMPDCSFSKYTLQMSLYAYMLERQGYKIGKLTLLHLKEDIAEPIEVVYEKEKIEALIAWSQL